MTEQPILEASNSQTQSPTSIARTSVSTGKDQKARNEFFEAQRQNSGRPTVDSQRQRSVVKKFQIREVKDVEAKDQKDVLDFNKIAYGNPTYTFYKEFSDSPITITRENGRLTKVSFKQNSFEVDKDKDKDGIINFVVQSKDKPSSKYHVKISNETDISISKNGGTVILTGKLKRDN